VQTIEGVSSAAVYAGYNPLSQGKSYILLLLRRLNAGYAQRGTMDCEKMYDCQFEGGSIYSFVIADCVMRLLSVIVSSHVRACNM
jgi:hypothetical protein